MEDNIEKISYDDIVNKVNELINKSLLTNEEKNLIALFAINYCNKNILHTNDLGPADIKGSEVIQKARLLNTIGAQILLNTGSLEYLNITNHQNNSSDKINGRSYVRQLTSDNYHGETTDEEMQIENANPNVNGFSNVILILLITIACGIFLASLLI